MLCLVAVVLLVDIQYVDQFGRVFGSSEVYIAPVGVSMLNRHVFIYCNINLIHPWKFIWK